MSVHRSAGRWVDRRSDLAAVHLSLVRPQRVIDRFISPFTGPDCGIGLEFAFNLRASSAEFSVHLYSGSVVTRP